MIAIAVFVLFAKAGAILNVSMAMITLLITIMRWIIVSKHLEK